MENETKGIGIVALTALIAAASVAKAEDYAPIVFFNVPNYYGNFFDTYRYESPYDAFVVEWESKNPYCPPGISGWDFVGAFPSQSGPPGAYYEADYMLFYCDGRPPRGPYPYGSIARRWAGCTAKGPWSYSPDGLECGVEADEADPEKNRGRPCDERCSVGDPINVGVGNKFEEKVEYRGSGPFPLIFSWVYNSSGVPLTATPQQLALGGMRVHNYSQAVRLYSTGTLSTAYVSRPSGNTERFNLENGSWVGAAGNRARLEQQTAANGSTIGWTYFSSSGQTEYYDDIGRLETIKNLAGLEQNLAYDSKNRLTGVVGPTGRSLTFVYDAGRFLERLILPDGSAIEFSYGAAGLLESVLYPDGNTVQYLYNESAFVTSGTKFGALTGIIDELGSRYSSTTYDGNTRATSTHLSGNVDEYTVSYTLAPNATYAVTAQVTTPLGAVRTLDFTAIQGSPRLTRFQEDCAGCTPSISQISYDTSGRRDIEVGAEGHITDYDYNTRGLESQRIEGATSGSQRTIQTDWHPDFRVPVERRTYNAAGTLVAKSVMTYNARGQLLTETKMDPATGSTRTRSSSYCEQVDVDAFGSTCPLLGLLKAVDGPRIDVNDVTTFDYYAATDESGCETGGACHRKGDLWKATNAQGHVTEYTRYDRAGRVTQIADPNNLITDFEYHARGWLTARKVRGLNPGVETDDRSTLIEYWSTELVEKITQPDGGFIAFSYDAAHRLTGINDNDNNIVEYTLDSEGNRTLEDIRDASGTLRRTLSRTYNQLGELQALIDGEANSTGFTYDADGSVDTFTDPLGAVTDHDYDPLTRLSKTLQDVGGIDAESTYDYDARDNLTSVTAANGAVTTYEYDGLDDLEKETSPDRGATVYTYDAAGNQKTKLDARGKLTSYTYDALDRLTLITLDGGGTIAYEYDVGSNAIGRLAKITDASGRTTWSYDHFGAVSQKVQTIGTATLVTNYAYAPDGRATSMTLPSGKVVSYGYTGHRRTTVSVDSSVILSGATYEPFGRVNGWTWGFGAPTSHEYDLRGLASAVNLGGESVSLGRDAKGQVTSATFPLSGFDLDFDYDFLGRLNSFGSNPPAAPLPVPDSQLFAYDGNGNRQSLVEDGTSYSYTSVANSNRLSGTTGPVVKSFSYDAAGNVTGDGTHSYGYDDRGRLVSVDSGAATYAHNGQGQRVKKDVGGTVTLFAYDESGRLIGEYDGQGNAKMEHVWFDDRPVAALKGSVMYSVDTDHLGAPRVISEGFAGTVWTWISEPFGSTPAQEYTDGAGVLFKYHLRFPGQYYDEETGLHYNYFRTYDPSTGRYLESDPIGLGGGLNTYAYVGNMPMTYVDPFGLDRLPPSYPVSHPDYYQGPKGDYYDTTGLPRPAPGPGAQVGVGASACVFGLCASRDFILDEYARRELSSSTLESGATLSVCFNINESECETSSEDDIRDLGWGFGLGRRLGLSKAPGEYCINLGLGIGLPVEKPTDLGPIT